MAPVIQLSLYMLLAYDVFLIWKPSNFTIVTTIFFRCIVLKQIDPKLTFWKHNYMFTYKFLLHVV